MLPLIKVQGCLAVGLAFVCIAGLSDSVTVRLFCGAGAFGAGLMCQWFFFSLISGFNKNG